MMTLSDKPPTPGTADVVQSAYAARLVVPAFNVPHLPMVQPVIQAVVAVDCFALVETARLEWIRFGAQGPAEVMREFMRWYEPDHVRLHLDHVPVIDEDNKRVDYLGIIQEALLLGYQSVMVDGSRLALEENIKATRLAVELAHNAGVPCEAELGAVMGHEARAHPHYEELFSSGMGFTDVAEAERFVPETGCDWLSVAIGNVHGAVSGALRHEKKVEARLNLDHLDQLRRVTGVPLVLHGGSGIRRDHVVAAVRSGISKINIGTELRQAYEATLRSSGSIAAARSAVFDKTCWLLRDHLGLAGTRRQVMGQVPDSERSSASVY